MALWDMRSPIGLMGGALDATRGVWRSGHASIGAGTDSFYEYLHKSGVLLRDNGMGSMFAEAYGAVEKHLRWGPWHVEADMQRGRKVRRRVRGPDHVAAVRVPGNPLNRSGSVVLRAGLPASPRMGDRLTHDWFSRVLRVDRDRRLCPVREASDVGCRGWTTDRTGVPGSGGW